MIIDILKEKVNNFSRPEIGTYTFLSPHTYNYARKNSALYSCFDTIYLDGMFLTALVNLFIKKKIRRFSFDMTSIANDYFEYIGNNNKHVVFCGGKKDDIKRFSEIIIEKYPKIKNAFFCDGYSLKGNDLVKLIISHNPEIIILGLGYKYQDEIAIELKNYLQPNVCIITCGAFITQSAKKFEYYPKLINKLELRWLYRIFNEKGILSRIVVQYTLFFLYFILDICKYLIFKIFR